MDTTDSKFQQNPPLKAHNIFVATQICLRILAIVTALAATLMMLTSKQTTVVLGLTIDARYSYASAFKFFAFANAFACAFSFLSLFFPFIIESGGSNPNNYFFLFLHDLFMMLLVLAGCAAATAIGYVGKYGYSQTGWMAICDHFGKFCSRVTTSLLLSYLSLLSLLMLTIISASKSRQIHVDN